MTVTEPAPVPPAPDTGSPDLLAFAETQARPLRLAIPPDGDDATPAPVRRAGAATPLPAGLHRLLDDVPYPRATVDERVPLATRVLGVLAGAGPQRFEARSAVNPHRGYPAAHCFFACEIFLRAGDAAWHYDPVGHRLVPVAGTGAADPAGAISRQGGAVLAVLAHLGGIPSRYRELRWALALCEAGHLTEQLALVAGAHRLAAAVRHDFPDAALLADLGCDPAQDWIPASVLEVGSARLDLTGAAEPPDTPATTDTALAVDRAGWSTAPAGPATPKGLPEPAGGAAALSWSELLFQRSAGRCNKGFTAAPGPLPPGAVADVARALTGTLGGQPEPERGGIQPILIVDRAGGLAPGSYLPDADGTLRRIGDGPGMAAVQRAFSYPMTEMSVLSCPAAVVFVVDHAGQLAAGARRLRTAQLELGAAAQAAGFAITPHGGFLRPARSFDPDSLATELGLPPGRIPGYLALLGVNRFTDLLLDVRP